jgi:hypothetical protein
METVPVPDPIESRSIGQDAETRRFQRLERVRARQRARRHRLILVIVLAFVLSSIALLGLSQRQTISGAVLAPSAASTTPAAMSMSVTVPAATLPSTVSAPARLDGVTRHQTTTARPPAESPPVVRRPTPSRTHTGESASVPSHPERDPDIGDGTAAIDWLLKTSRPGSP